MTFLVREKFNPYPGGRYKQDGRWSGELFRDDFLQPLLEADHEKIIIDFEGVSTVAVSFIEEAFGGLVRAGFTASSLRSRIEIKCERPTVAELVWQCIDQAQMRIDAE